MCSVVRALVFRESRTHTFRNSISNMTVDPQMCPPYNEATDSGLRVCKWPKGLKAQGLAIRYLANKFATVWMGLQKKSNSLQEAIQGHFNTTPRHWAQHPQSDVTPNNDCTRLMTCFHLCLPPRVSAICHRGQTAVARGSLSSLGSSPLRVSRCGEALEKQLCVCL